MRLLPILSLLAATTAFAQSAAPASSATQPGTPNSKPETTSTSTLPTIFVCGDSTAKNTAGGAQGWGTAIAAYFDSTKATVNNVAHAGTSSLTYYYNPGDWPSVLPKIKAGDYVLEVFGINDGTTPNGIGDETKDVTVRNQLYKDAHTYGWYMAKMATDAQSKGAHVFLLTVTDRNIWTNPNATFRDATITDKKDNYDPKDDKIERGTSNGRYTQWTKDVGAKLHLPVLDLTNLSADLYEKTGREKVMVNYLDHNHTNPTGADIVAHTIVSGLKAFKNSPFTALLSDKGKAVPTADAKYVTENSANAADPKPDAAKPATSAK